MSCSEIRKGRGRDGSFGAQTDAARTLSSHPQVARLCFTFLRSSLQRSLSKLVLTLDRSTFGLSVAADFAKHRQGCAFSRPRLLLDHHLALHSHTHHRRTFRTFALHPKRSSQLRATHSLHASDLSGTSEAVTLAAARSKTTATYHISHAHFGSARQRPHHRFRAFLALTPSQCRSSIPDST